MGQEKEQIFHYGDYVDDRYAHEKMLNIISHQETAS